MAVDLRSVASAAQALADACGAGAVDGSWFSSDLAATAMVKSIAEKRYTLGVAYPALRPDVAKAVDGFRDAIAPDALEETAWEWMRKSRRIGLLHGDLFGRGSGEGHAEPVESYIYRGPDWTITGANGQQQLVKAGDWLLGLVYDAETWPLVKAGLIDGLSPQGSARRRRPSPAFLAQLQR